MNLRMDVLTAIASESQARILSEARIWQALGRGKSWQDGQIEHRPESSSRTDAGEIRRTLARIRP